MKKGDCYEAAGKYVVDQFVLGNDKLVLVHGTVIGTGGDVKGVGYGHAWVEDGETIFDKSNGRNLELPKVLYYHVGQITETQRYSFKEAQKAILDTGHWGPWGEESDY